MTKLSRTARKTCFECEEQLDLRHDNHVIRVYRDDRKLTAVFHMECADHIQ